VPNVVSNAATLTPDRILALAPDPASARAAAALAGARRWSGLGGDGEGRAVWGECQGSGATPYRTQVDLRDLATRCSCPSRKFPCKHALGLLLLLLASPELFGVSDRPAWVAEWLAGRAERRPRDDPGPPPEQDAADAETAARASETARRRRERARADKIAAGLAELARWLEDLVRGGLASVGSRPAAFWATAAARLVDAQAPGAARLVRQLAAIPGSGADWAERMVAALARLHLLAESYARLATLPPPLQADVRAAIGWAPAGDESDDDVVADRWLVVGQVVVVEDRLRARRTWLVGARTGRHALLLHFAHGTAPFAEPAPSVGGTLAGELAFLPGSAPIRATVRSRDTSAAGGGVAGTQPAGHARVVDALAGWAAAVAANPWTERVLVVLAAAVPERRGDRWLVRDAGGAELPVAAPFRAGWPLVALAGGRPVWLAGEWDGERLLPLAVSAPDGAIISLTPARAEAAA